MIRNQFGEFWRKKELEAGRIIPVAEVAAATNLHWETVSNFKEGKTSRFDAKVLAPLCDYFEVKPGDPIPFLIFDKVS